MKNKCAWCEEEAELYKLTATKKDEIMYGAWICDECLKSIKEMSEQIKYYYPKFKNEVKK